RSGDRGNGSWSATFRWGWAKSGWGAAGFGRSQQAARPDVGDPGQGRAADVEGHEAPQGDLRPAGRVDGGAVGLGNEEGAEGGYGRGEADGGGGLTVGAHPLLGRRQLGGQARRFEGHDRADHLEGRGVADAGQEEQGD